MATAPRGWPPSLPCGENGHNRAVVLKRRRMARDDFLGRVLLMAIVALAAKLRCGAQAPTRKGGRSTLNRCLVQLARGADAGSRTNRRNTRTPPSAATPTAGWIRTLVARLRAPACRPGSIASNGKKLRIQLALSLRAIDKVGHIEVRRFADAANSAAQRPIRPSFPAASVNRPPSF